MTMAPTRSQLVVGFVAALVLGVGVAATSLPAPVRVAMVATAAVGLLLAWRKGSGVRSQSVVDDEWSQAVLRRQVMRELSRARRTSSHVVLAAVSLDGDQEAMASEAEMAGNMVRLHDLVGHDRQRSELNLVAVVPDDSAASAFVAKVAGQFGSDRVRSATSGAEATSAVELIAQLDRSPSTSVSATFAGHSA